MTRRDSLQSSTPVRRARSAPAKVTAVWPTADNWDDENHGSVSSLAKLDVALEGPSSPSWIDRGYGWCCRPRGTVDWKRCEPKLRESVDAYDAKCGDGTNAGGIVLRTGRNRGIYFALHPMPRSKQ